jgi:Protein of unknown function (DUF3631)
VAGEASLDRAAAGVGGLQMVAPLLRRGRRPWAVDDPQDVVTTAAQRVAFAAVRPALSLRWLPDLRIAGGGVMEIDGAALLDEVYDFLDRFIAYPSEAAHVAHTLWIAHTWFMDRWESTPRIAFLSPEPGSGKSRALEVTEPLVPRPIHAVNTTPAYLFRKVSDAAGLPTILYDEIDTIFGPKAKDNEDIRGMLNAGHRKGAVAGRCVNRGNIVITEELPAYCAVALAGLNDLPETLHTRSVIIRMKKRAPYEQVEPWRARINAPEGWPIGDRLRDWSDSAGKLLRWPEMPYAIQDRDADVWESLVAVADLAGGDAWPERARTAAVTLVTANQDRKTSLGVTLLADLRTVFGDRNVMATETILPKLHAIEESPWGGIRGKPLDARGLSSRLRRYDVHPKPVRIDASTVSKGYRREDLADLWARYVGPEGASRKSVTSVTSVTDDPDVTDVTDVTDKSEGAPGCQVLTWRVCPNRNCQAFGSCVLEGESA